MKNHESHWTKRQVRSLNKAIREGATIAFTLTGPEGEPCNGGESSQDQYARPGLTQESKGPFKLCYPGVFHATLEPHRWEGSRVWIVALYGKVECEANTYKLGALKREFIGEVLAHEAMDPRIGIKLGRKDLAGSDLSGASLYEADLCGADLSGAKLHGAYFYRVNLSEANLRGANLSYETLYETDLSKANLEGTNLRWANFNKASLSEANLYKANLNGANLGDWERGPDGYARRKQ
jgi:hypothetical protein